MNSTFIKATLAGTGVLFVVGFLVFGLLLSGFYESNVGSATGVAKDSPGWLSLIISTLATSATLTLVLTWKFDVRDAASGASAAALFGLLVAIAANFGTYSMTNVQTLTVTLVDPILTAGYMAIGGAVIGIVIGRNR